MSSGSISNWPTKVSFSYHPYIWRKEGEEGEGGGGGGGKKGREGDSCSTWD